MRNRENATWSVGHGIVGGKEAHYSLNNLSAYGFTRGTHPFEAHFAIEVIDQNEMGLPRTDSELDRLHQIEDEIVKIIEKDDATILGLLVTLDCYRDLFFHSSDPDAIIEGFETRIKPVSQWNIDLNIRRDRWRYYSRFEGVIA